MLIKAQEGARGFQHSTNRRKSFFPLTLSACHLTVSSLKKEFLSHPQLDPDSHVSNKQPHHKVHPVIAKFEETGERAVEIRGYVGSSRDGIICLYTDLSMTTYREIPEDKIIHSEEISDQGSGMVRLFVMAGTYVQAVRSIRITVEAVRADDVQPVAIEAPVASGGKRQPQKGDSKVDSKAALYRKALAEGHPR